MQATQTAPQGKDTASQGELFVSFELADKTWKLSLSDGRRGASRYTVDAGDTVAVWECLTKLPAGRMRQLLGHQELADRSL
jgi:transposase